MTCALRHDGGEDVSPSTAALRVETQNGTFVALRMFVRNSNVALDTVRMRRRGKGRRVVAASPLVWHDAPQHTPLDAHATPRCVNCGARQHTGDACPNDALDFDDRDTEARP